MNTDSILSDAKSKFNVAIDHLSNELKKLRTGRANAAMLDGIVVEAYGTQMPLIQVATISVPESQLIQITPFDPNNLSVISSAIRENQSFGLNPSDDGHVIRVPIPPLTEERRKEIVKLVGQKQEECMITLRSIRHEAMDSIDRAKKGKEISEDDAKRSEKQIDEAMNSTRSQVEAASKSKESEILTV
jgi:ribosome recycling factor